MNRANRGAVLEAGVGSTDLLLTAPRLRARAVAAHMKLVLLPVPFQLPPFDMRVYWHRAGRYRPAQPVAPVAARARRRGARPRPPTPLGHDLIYSAQHTRSGLLQASGRTEPPLARHNAAPCTQESPSWIHGLFKPRGELRGVDTSRLDAANVDSLRCAPADEDMEAVSAVIIENSRVLPRTEQIVLVMADEFVRVRAAAVAA